MILKIIVSLVFLDQLAKGAETIAGELAPQSLANNVGEDDTDELVSLAEHIREDPLIVDQFTPNVCKILVLIKL